MSKPVYIFVTPFFPSESSWRGAFCYDFVKALMLDGRYEVKVFKVGDDYDFQGIRVHGFRTKNLPSALFPFLFRRHNERSFLNAVLRAGVNMQDVCICHAHTALYGIYALAIKKLAPRCKALLHHHDPQSFGLNLGILRNCWLYNMVQFPILRRIHDRIDIHIFISEAVRRSFIEAPSTKSSYYDGYKRQMRWLPYRPAHIKRSIIVHNGVDLAIFNRQVKATNCHEHDNCFTVGCIGNFVDWKDQITLLRAVDIVMKSRTGYTLKLVFVGSGPEQNKCKDYAFLHGINVEFLREVRHEELQSFYKKLDLFVLPSYCEGFGCVFTEAWACGVPFITCLGQGMDDYIQGEDANIWLFEPRNYFQLAERIKFYMKNRPAQRLTGEININNIVGRFIDEIYSEC